MPKTNYRSPKRPSHAGPATKLTFQEFCQVLAALRHWQDSYKRSPMDAIKVIWDEHFADCEPMTMEAIDNLCEKINCE